MSPLLVLYLTSLFTPLFYGTGFGMNEDAEESIVIKARMRVENAAVNDWKTLAECASTLLEHHIVSNDVRQWIEKSMLIEENYLNVSVYGDYYRLMKEFTTANQYYIRAIDLARKKNPGAIAGIQWKILVTLGTANYYSFQK